MLTLPEYSLSTRNVIHHMDALQLMRGLADESVDMVLTDPPYFKVKDDEWDNQWPNRTAYLDWLRQLLVQYQRVLKPNGSLYLFASPQMAAYVEVTTADYFSVLNRITWRKPAFSTKAEMFDKDSMRAFFPASEVIIFADKFYSDGDYNSAIIAENDTYWTALEGAKRSLFGNYLETEFERAGVTRREIAELFPSKTGGLTGCVSNWILGYNCPTPDQYEKMRVFLNTGKQEYLRREYEDLRREYEDLRRPFHARSDMPYTDVWEFKTVGAYEGKHPAEKPIDLIKHIIRTSSNPGALILDTFGGSGTTFDAARQLDRDYIGSDFDRRWVDYARHRVGLPYAVDMFSQLQDSDPYQPTVHENGTKQLSLFESVA